jgi:hypothetical protein
MYIEKKLTINFINKYDDDTQIIILKSSFEYESIGIIFVAISHIY